MVSVGEITVELNLDATKLTSGLQSALSQLDSFGSKVSSIEGRISDPSMFSGLTSTLGSIGTAVTTAAVTGLVAVGTAVTGAALAAREGLAAFEDFETAVVKTASASGLSGQAFIETKNAISEISKELGEKTIYSSLEAADALYELASAGYDVVAMGTQGLLPFLYLASGTQADLADTTAMMTATLSNFQLGMDQTGRVADVFAASIMGSQATMEKLGVSMGYVGSFAEMLGISLEETVAALSVLYNGGLLGQKAGTGLRKVMASLINPTADAQAALAEMGLTVGDVSLLTNNFADVMQLLSDRQMNAAQAARIFGLTGAPAASIFMGATDDIYRYTDALKESGGAAELMATQQMDTLAGSMERLRGNIQNLWIGIGEALSPAARAIADSMTSMMPGIEAFTSGVAKSVGDLILSLGDSAKAAVTIGSTIWDAINQIFMATGGSSAVDGLGDIINSIMTRIAGIVVDVTPTIQNAIINIINFIKNIFSGLDPTVDNLKTIANNILSILNALFAGMLSSGGEQAAASVAGVINLFTTVLAGLSSVIAAASIPIINGLKTLWSKLSETAGDINWDTILTSVSAAFTKITEFVAKYATMIGGMIGSDAAVEAIADAFTFLRSAFEAIVSVVSTVGGAIKSAFDFAKEHPAVTKVALAVVALGVGFSILAPIISALTFAFTTLQAIFPILGLSFSGMVSSFLASTASITGILGIVGATLFAGFDSINKELRSIDWSGIWDNLTKAFGNVINNLSPFIGVLKEYLSRLPEMFSAAIENISPVIGLLGTIFQDIVVVFASFVENIAPTVWSWRGIFDDILNVVFTVGGALVNAITTLIGELAKNYRGMLMTIDFSAIGKLIASGFNLASEILGAAVSEISDFILSIPWDAIFSGIGAALLAFSDLMMKIPWGDIINFIVSALQKFVDYLSGLDWEGMFNGLSVSLTDIWNFIEGLPWDSILTIIGTPFKLLFDLLMSIDWTGVFNTISGAFSALWDYISSVDWSGILTTVSDAFGDLWDFISGLDWEGFFNWLGEVFTAVSDIIGSIDWAGILKFVVDAFGTVWDYLSGLDWEGFFDAISQAFTDISDAIGEINWSEIFTAVKDAFGTVWDYLQEVDFGSVLALVGEAFTKLYDAVKNLDFGKLFDDIKKGLSEIFGGGGDESGTAAGVNQLELMRKQAEELTTAIQNEFTKAQTALSNFNVAWASAWMAINTTTSLAITAIVSSVIAGSGQVSAGLATLNTMWTAGWAIINASTVTSVLQISSSILTGIPTINAALLSIVTGLLTMNSQWTAAWALVNATTSTSFAMLVTTIIAGVASISTALLQMVTGLTTMTASWTAGWMQTVVATATSMGSVVQTIIVGVASVGIQLNMMVAAINTMNQQWTAAWTMVRVATMAQILSILSVIRNGAASVSALSSSWRAAGVAIGAALAAGLNSQVSAVRSASQALANAAKVNASGSSGSSGTSGTSGVTRSGGGGTGETNVKINTINNNGGNLSATKLSKAGV